MLLRKMRLQKKLIYRSQNMLKRLKSIWMVLWILLGQISKRVNLSEESSLVEILNEFFIEEAKDV